MKKTLLLLSVLFLAGCKKSAEVSGTVTFKGKALANGYITFFPAGADGNAAGAKITAGKYTLTDIPPGKRRVLITSHAEVKEDNSAGAPRISLLPHERIPADAKGNNKIVEVQAGTQTINFDL
jgi:hypothetical protein